MTLEKQFPISVIYETKTEEEWLTVEKENGGIYIIPEGRPIIYKYPNENGYYHRMKIGDGVSTISQLSFNSEEGANVSTISKFDNIQTVPTNAAKYAEINEIGGMTYKVEETETVTYGPYTFENNSVVIPAGGIPAEDYDYAIYVKNLSSTRQTISFDIAAVDGSGGRWNFFDSFPVPPDGEFHLHTGSKIKSTNSTIDSKITAKGSLGTGTFEVSTLTFYEKGGAPKTVKELRYAAVTTVESAGANLLAYPYPQTTSVVNGVTFTDNGDGTITANGTATATSYLTLAGGYAYEKVGIPSWLKVGNTYTIYSDSPSAEIQVYFYKDDGGSMSISSAAGGTFEVPEGYSYFGIFAYVGGGATVNNLIFKPMLVNGSTILPYSPYSKHTYPIPAEVQALEGYGLGIDETNYNYIDWGKKQFVQKVKHLVLDGTESINYSNARFFIYGKITAPAQDYTVSCLCNEYAHNANVYKDTDREDGIIIGESSIYIRDARFTTTTELKSYLTERYNEGNPVEVVYQLATPIVTDISNIVGNNVLSVEANGTLTFVNENNYNVYSTINYYTADKIDTIYTGKFVGETVGEFVGDIKATSFELVEGENKIISKNSYAFGRENVVG